MSKGVVVKRSGEDEPYDERKLYAGIFLSLRVAGQQEKEAEIIAAEIVKILGRWLEKKGHVTAHDIREHVTHHLAEYNRTASYLYQHHRVLS